MNTSANIVSANEASSIIKTSVMTLLNNPELAHALPAICFRGAPGVGKSSIIRSVADALGIEFRDMRLADLERVDISGLPSVENGQTKWNVPSFLPSDPKSKGILLLDEITAAPHDCQVAAYSLVLDRTIPNSNYRLPDGWYVIAAGNRTTDRAVAKTMSSALSNRFMHFELEANPEDWAIWAVAHDIHPSVTGYIQFRPSCLFRMNDENLECGWPSPRSWEKVSNMIPLFDGNEDVLRKIVYGLVGPSAGLEFMEFHRHNKKTADVLKWLTNAKAVIEIPQKADERYAVTAAASYLVWNGKNEKDDKKRADGILRLAMELPSSFATSLFKQVCVGNKRVSRMKALAYIASAPSYKAFSEKFAKLADEIKNATLDV